MATIFSIIIAIWILHATIEVAVGLFRIFLAAVLYAASCFMWTVAILLECLCRLWQTAFETE